MENLPRGQAAAAAVTVAAAGANTEEDDDEDEDEGGGQPFDRPKQEIIVVLDSDGELEDVIPTRQQERPPRVILEADNGKASGNEGVPGEDVQAWLVGLKGSIAQFFSAKDRGQTDGAASAVTGKAASAAEAVALLCSRCLHAHLGTSLSALSQRARPPPVFSGGVPGQECRKEENKDEQEVEGEEAFLCLLREVCGGGRSDGSGPQPGLLGETTDEVQREASHADPTADDNSLRKESNRKEPQPTGSVDHSGKPSSQLCHEEGKSSAVGREVVADEKDSADRRASLDRDSGSGSSVPEFLLQLEAGWVLASAVWEGVALLERARDYDRAVELLVQLLATRCVGTGGWV